MIGIWSSNSKEFLVVVSVLTILFAAPMLIHPLGWARALKWRIPAEADLAIYFGRCLGGVVTVLACMGLVAREKSEVLPFYFSTIIAAIGVNILVHIWGAVRKIQPLTETVEIIVSAVLLILCLMFYPHHWSIA